MYRDDADAARARVESLTVELRTANAELAAIKERGVCKLPEHVQLAARLGELVRAVEAQRERKSAPSPHAKQEEELTRLRVQLADLELLASGAEAMEQKLADCERAIEGLAAARDNDTSLTIPTAPSDEDWVWVPRRGALRHAARWLTTAGTVVAGVAIAFVAGGFGAIAVGAGLLSLGGVMLTTRKLREDALLAAQANTIAIGGVRWASVTGIRFERDPVRMLVEMPGRTLVFRTTDDGYPHVVEYARTAVALHGIPVTGEFPKLLAGAT